MRSGFLQRWPTLPFFFFFTSRPPPKSDTKREGGGKARQRLHPAVLKASLPPASPPGSPLKAHASSLLEQAAVLASLHSLRPAPTHPPSPGTATAATLPPAQQPLCKLWGALPRASASRPEPGPGPGCCGGGGGEGGGSGGGSLPASRTLTPSLPPAFSFAPSRAPSRALLAKPNGHCAALATSRSPGYSRLARG